MHSYLFGTDKLVRFQLLPQAKLSAISAINFSTKIQTAKTTKVLYIKITYEEVFPNENNGFSKIFYYLNPKGYSSALIFLFHSKEYWNTTRQSFPVFIQYIVEHFQEMSKSLWKIQDPSDFCKGNQN